MSRNIELPNPGAITIRTDGKRIHAIVDQWGQPVERVVAIAVRQAGNELGTATLTRHLFEYSAERGLYDPCNYEQQCVVLGYELI